MDLKKSIQCFFGFHHPIRRTGFIQNMKYEGSKMSKSQNKITQFFKPLDPKWETWSECKFCRLSLTKE